MSRQLSHLSGGDLISHTARCLQSAYGTIQEQAGDIGGSSAIVDAVEALFAVYARRHGDAVKGNGTFMHKIPIDPRNVVEASTFIASPATYTVTDSSNALQQGTLSVDWEPTYLDHGSSDIPVVAADGTGTRYTGRVMVHADAVSKSLTMW